MKQSQAIHILNLLQMAKDHKVTCGQLAKLGLFHKAASRCSELRKQGFDIRYHAGDTWDTSYYALYAGREGGQVFGDTSRIPSPQTSFGPDDQGELPELYNTIRFE